VLGDSAEALNKLRELLGGTKPQNGVHAVCACDREVDAPKIAALIHSMGSDAVNPLGSAHGTHALHHGLRLWSRFLGHKEPDFLTAQQALRHPALVRAATGNATAKVFTEVNANVDAADLAMLRGTLSEVCAKIAELPAPGDGDVRRKIVFDTVCTVANTLAALRDLRRRHQALPWEESLATAIAMLIGDRKLRQDDIEDAYAIEVADELMATAGKIAQAEAERGLGLSHEELLTLTLDSTADKRFRQSDAQEAVNLPGWVESVWEPVPHLVIFGLNDHLQPRVTHAHPFLPAVLRELAGLPKNDEVFAIAAFTIEQLWRRREPHGWLDIIVPQQDAQGNPLRPSRLLFLGPDEALTARVDLLFSEMTDPGTQPYWEIPAEHKLSPLAEKQMAVKVAQRISATAFKTYLVDPADFWLKHAIGMQETEHGRLELDAAGFGTLVHGTLERFGREHLGKRLESVEEIKASLLRHLDEQAQASLGNLPAAALRVQAQSARERLTAFAPVQLKLFQEGWVIDTVEGTLPEMELEGVRVTGKFDRLDRNADGRRWRVYDYKTFANLEEPLKKHTRKAQPEDKFTTTVPVRDNGDKITKQADVAWMDLQLPTYYHALKPTLKSTAVEANGVPAGANLEVAYICLPAEVAKTAVKVWELFDKDYAESSLQAIRDVVRRLKEGGAANFAPSERTNPYPVLKSLSGRPIEAYLNIEQLGGVRP
jgi:ATP-dependent helicase/nuclease subunit B